MQTRFLQFVFCLICCVGLAGLASAAPVAPAAPPPKALAIQIERLVGLLKDRYAVGYPDATMTQKVKLGTGQEWVLAVFTIEGFGGGNSHSQYLAVFEVDNEDKLNPFYSLLDFIHIGGKGWRGIHRLAAKVSMVGNTGVVNISLDAMMVGEGDGPNFPSKKTTIRLQLKDGRLME